MLFRSVYSGPNVFTLEPVLAVRPDGTPVEMPQIRIHRDGERLRFLPSGRALVYMQGEGATPWQDFWLLDLKTMNSRRLTQRSERAAMRTFDITPDGKQIVFDRFRDNSAVVQIDFAATAGTRRPEACTNSSRKSRSELGLEINRRRTMANTVAPSVGTAF